MPRLLLSVNTHLRMVHNVAAHLLALLLPSLQGSALLFGTLGSLLLLQQLRCSLLSSCLSPGCNRSLLCPG